MRAKAGIAVKPSAWTYLLWRESSSRPGRSLLVLFCVIVSAALAGLAIHFLLYLRTEVRPLLEKMFPENRLVVRPPDMNIAILKVQTGSITDATVNAIRELDGVEAVYPQLPAEFPVSAEIVIGRMDAEFQSDIILHGIPGALLEEEQANPQQGLFEWEPGSTAPVPVAISAYFLDMYNLGLSESANLPKMSESAALGREFDLLLGESSLGFSSGKKYRRQRARIVALSKNPLLVGIAAPLEAVKAWNKEFASYKPVEYSLLHIDCADSGTAVDIAQQIRVLGFPAQLASENLEQASRIVSAAEGGLVAVAAVILALSGIGIFSTVAMSTRERRPVWGLHRATGLARSTLLSVILAESLVISLIGAAVAIALAAGALAGFDAAFGGALDEMAVLPSSPFVMHWGAPLSIVLLAVAMTAIPAFLFALPALRCEPARLFEHRGI